MKAFSFTSLLREGVSTALITEILVKADWEERRSG